MTTSASGKAVRNDEALLRLRKVRQTFGNIEAVAGLDLDVHAGELFTLLGPSGCGKSTTLRIIAGLEFPDSGELWVDDHLIFGGGVCVPPHRRNMGMVFQSYAIWPHMTVFENVAYPLRARGVPRESIKTRVAQVLARVDLAGMETRPAPALSGGQQQRVAIARALVYEPRLLLLDEPFSNLDAKLREQMRSELKKLLKGLDITVFLVTHDQFEALGVSDRIAVMNGGRIEQIGTATELYDSPKNPFVRDFLGRVALLRGSVVSVAPQGRLTVSLPSHGGVSHFHVDQQQGSSVRVGQDVVVAIRPEQVGVMQAAGDCDIQAKAENRTVGVIESLMFAGDRHEARIRMGEISFSGYLPRSQMWNEGQTVVLSFPPKELCVWTA